MASWVLKAVIQKTISYLPYKHQINYLFQKHVTKGLVLTDELFISKLIHSKQHLYAKNEIGKINGSFVSLELGTGWFPIVPIAMYLSGAEKIYSADIKFMVSHNSMKESLDKFIEFHNKHALEEYLGDYSSDRLLQLKQFVDDGHSLSDILQFIRLEILLGDLSARPAHTISPVHLIHSNNTFEHIPAEMLSKLLRFFAQISASENSISSHFIDMSDHFSHLDKHLSPYNYLKYSEARWALIDNSIQPQNRLRICEYNTIFKESGWEILEETATISDRFQLDIQNVHPSKRHMSVECLNKTHAHVICRVMHK